MNIEGKKVKFFAYVFKQAQENSTIATLVSIT
jgi:hypothetical protein